MTEKIKMASLYGYDSYTEEESDSSSVSSKEEEEEEEDEAGVEEELSKEFKKVYKEYRDPCKDIKWNKMYPDAGWDDADFEFPWDLWSVDMSLVLNHLAELEKKKPKFGHLLKMVITSRGSIGALLAQSFCERINSAGNIVMTQGNTLLGDEELNMLVVLRMNRFFMKFMRKKFPKVDFETLAQLTEKQNEVEVEDNVDMEEDD